MSSISVYSVRRSLRIANFTSTISVLFLLFSWHSALAQVVYPSDTIAPPVPGVGHDYITTFNETVNPENGGVNLQLAMPIPPARKLTIPFSLNYNSTEVSFFTGDWSVGFGTTATTSQETFGSGGWSYGLPKLNNFTQTIVIPGPAGGTNTPDESSVCGVTSNYTFTALDGSAHMLGLSHVYDNSPGYYGAQNYECYNSHFSEYDTSSDDPLYHAQFTALTPDSSHDTTNPAQPNDGNPQVVGPDGTLYTFPWLGCLSTYNPIPCSRLPSSIEDKDGNIVNIDVGAQLNFPTVTMRDTAGRSVLNATASSITIAGLTSSYTVTRSSQTFSGYTVNSQNNSPQGTLFCAPTGTKLSTGALIQSVITALKLPNGQSYSFAYDPQYGTLSKITYPSGGYIRYVYGLNPLSTGLIFNGRPAGFGGQMTIAPDACIIELDAVALLHRYVSFDGSSEVLQQDFNYQTNWSGTSSIWLTKTTTVTTHDLKRGTSYNTAYTYVPFQLFTPPNAGESTPVAVERNIVYSDTTGSVLKTVTKGWADQYSLSCEVDTIGSGGPSSATFYSYGPGDVVTDKKEYDLGLLTASSCSNGAVAPGGVPPTRETATTYQTFGNTTYSTPSLLDAPCRVVISDHGVPITEIDSYYDNGSAACGTPGHPNVSAVSNLTAFTHDEGAFGPGSTISRGDVTRIDKKGFGVSSTASVTATYDETGQVLTTTDACGTSSCQDMPGAQSHTTFYSYVDPQGTNSYLTSLSKPAVNGIQQTFSYNVNPSNGLLNSKTDVNNNLTTTYTYNDPLNRLTLIQGPPDPNNGNQSATTQYFYNDAPPKPSVSTSVLMTTSGSSLTGMTVMDGMGHTVQSQNTSDPSGVIYIDTSYDGDGRVWTVSNPYRTATDGTTTYTYDALGRQIQLTEQDGYSQLWCYQGVASGQLPGVCSGHLGAANNGAWTDHIDEVGNHWQYTYDSFGRLVETMEPGAASGSPILQTDYTYDALDDLLSVTQWGGSSGSAGARTRSFTYDGLSRLITSSNPETGAICYGQKSGNSCTNGYDANGNLQFKTDSRGITTSFTYDALNRLLSKTYASDPTGTATSCYQYDQSSLASTGANLVGHLTNRWTQTGACPATTPNFQSTGILSRRSVLAYDVMGRLSSEQQCNRSNCGTGSYTPFYTYDLTGDVTAHSNGLGTLTLTNFYDMGGHLSSMGCSGALCNSGVPLLFSGPTYSPAGQLSGASLGTGLRMLRTYDTRLRISGETDTDTTVSTPTPASATVTITGNEQSSN